MNSKKYSLNKSDMNKILVGANVAIAGAFLTYLSSTITDIDFGEYTPIVVAGTSILINIARKYISGER